MSDKKKYYRVTTRLFPYYTTNKGVFNMIDKNFGVNSIFSVLGIASTGVGVYALATEQSTTVVATAGAAAILCFYGAYRAVESRLEKVAEDEDRNERWRENDELHQRISKVEDRIDGLVTQNAFNNAVRETNESISSLRTDTNLDNEAVYRHISEEVRELNHRIDGVESGHACVEKRK